MEARLLLSRGHWPLIALATAAFALALFALAGTASAVDDDLVIAAPENPPFISADQGDMQRISGQEGTNDGTFSPPPATITVSTSSPTSLKNPFSFATTKIRPVSRSTACGDATVSLVCAAPGPASPPITITTSTTMRSHLAFILAPP